MTTTPVATLLPLTSVRNFQGAVDFIKWLKKTKQSGWQMLPISDPLATPYRGQGIGIASYFYDNRAPREYRTWVLDRTEFISKNQEWLLDYALWRALRERLGTGEWWQWPEELASRERGALIDWRARLNREIQAYVDEQYFLANQLTHLRRVASESEIMLMADLPFYLAQESALVWAHQELFVLGRGGELAMQSGVPPAKGEPFGAQLWGHPLYDWQGAGLGAVVELFAMRLRFLSQYFDLVRLDHANGFFRYGMMSQAHPTWSKKVDGPGEQALLLLLGQIQKMGLGVYFEDIASDRMRLEQFMKQYEIAGMEVVTLRYNLEQEEREKAQPVTAKQLRIGGAERSEAPSGGGAGKNRVLFTSTHDTPPLITWVKALPEEVRTKLIAANGLEAGVTDKGLAKQLRERLLEQEARLIVVPWQDWQLDNFRFNVPGREDLTNWDYLVRPEKYL